MAENDASHVLTFKREDGRILLNADGGIVSMSINEARRAAAELTRLTSERANGSAHSRLMKNAKEAQRPFRAIRDAMFDAFAAAAKPASRLTRVWNRLRHGKPGEP
jgi:hypothetical protein